MILGLGPVALAAILRSLAKQLRLQREDVVENPIDSPAFQPMVRDHPRALEVTPQRGPESAVDARLPPHLGFLQKLQAAVEGELTKPVLPNGHPAVLMCLELRRARHRSLEP